MAKASHFSKAFAERHHAPGLGVLSLAPICKDMAGSTPIAVPLVSKCGVIDTEILKRSKVLCEDTCTCTLRTLFCPPTMTFNPVSLVSRMVSVQRQELDPGWWCCQLHKKTQNVSCSAPDQIFWSEGWIRNLNTTKWVYSRADKCVFQKESGNKVEFFSFWKSRSSPLLHLPPGSNSGLNPLFSRCVILRVNAFQGCLFWCSSRRPSRKRLRLQLQVGCSCIFSWIQLLADKSLFFLPTRFAPGEIWRRLGLCCVVHWRKTRREPISLFQTQRTQN